MNKGGGQGAGEEKEVGDGDAPDDEGGEDEEAGLQEVEEGVGEEVVGGVEVLGEFVEDAAAWAGVLMWVGVWGCVRSYRRWSSRA